MAQYINKDTYVGDTTKQLKDIKTNADNITGILQSIANLSDKVIYDTGTGNSYEYIRFADGTMIQLKIISTSFKFLVWYGQIAYYDVGMGNWQIPFKSGKQIVVLNDYVHFLNGNNQGWTTNSGEVGYTSAGTMRICRPADEGLNVNWSANFCRIAWGYWK